MDHTDRTALIGGIALALLIPALLFWQSNYSDKGSRSPEDSQYKVDQYCNNMTECLFLGHCQILPLYAQCALDQDRNPKNFAAWLTYLQARRGEQCFIRWGWARLAMWNGDTKLARQELQKAWHLAASPEERKMIADTLQMVRP